MEKLVSIIIISFIVLVSLVCPITAAAQSISPADILSNILNLDEVIDSTTLQNSEPNSPQESPIPSNSPQPSTIPTASPIVSPLPSASPDSIPKPSNSPEPSPTVEPSPTTSPLPSPKPSPSPTAEPSPSPTPSPEVVGDLEENDPPPNDLGGNTFENADLSDGDITVQREDEVFLEPTNNVYEQVVDNSVDSMPAVRNALLGPLSIIVPDTAHGFVPSSEYDYNNQVSREVNTALSLISVISLLLAALLSKSQTLIKLLPFNKALFNR